MLSTTASHASMKAYLKTLLMQQYLDRDDHMGQLNSAIIRKRKKEKRKRGGGVYQGLVNEKKKVLDKW